MKTYRQWITEASIDPITDYLHARLVPGLVQGIAELEAAEKDGQIYNARYKEMKDRIIRRIDDALGAQFMHYKEQWYGKPLYYDIPHGVSSTVSIKKELRVTQEFVKQNPTLVGTKERLRMYIIASDLVARIVALKSKVIAGKPKVINPNAKQIFVPDFNAASSKAVVSMISTIVDSHKKEYIHNFHTTMVKEVDNLIISKGINPKEMSTKDRRDMRQKFRIFRFDDISKLYEYNGTLKKDWQSILKVIAEKETKVIFDKFIIKNARKLASIFEKKGMPQKHQVNQVKVNGLSLTTLMQFYFKDNSNFAVSNSIVFGWKQRGQYIQFPTRFHDVRLADGTSMKSPSEEKMNKEF